MEESFLRKIFEIGAELSTGNSKKNAECALLALDCVTLQSKVFERLAEDHKETVNYDLLKDGFSSVKAEFTKMMNLLGGENNENSTS